MFSLYEEFSNENYSRDYLLEYFNITEGRDALEKAHANEKIIKCLEDYHE